jgi:hypothetical protein
MNLNRQTKIIALWAVFLFGIVFHTQLAVMPLLYGQDVALPNAPGKAPVIDLWLMLVFFILPAIAIVATVLNDSKRYRAIHFWLTVAYSVMNLAHVVSDLAVRPIEWYQIVLLLGVFINGIFLNIVSFQWIKERVNGRRAVKTIDIPPSPLA